MIKLKGCLEAELKELVQHLLQFPLKFYNFLVKLWIAKLQKHMDKLRLQEEHFQHLLTKKKEVMLEDRSLQFSSSSSMSHKCNTIQIQILHMDKYVQEVQLFLENITKIPKILNKQLIRKDGIIQEILESYFPMEHLR